MDSNGSTLVAAPLAGKVVELRAVVWAESRMVAKMDTKVVLSVLKMVSVVTAPRTGRLGRRKGVDVVVVAVAGMLWPLWMRS